MKQTLVRTATNRFLLCKVQRTVLFLSCKSPTDDFIAKCNELTPRFLLSNFVCKSATNDYFAGEKMATTATTSSASVVQVTMGGGPATSAATVPSSSSAGPSCQENSGDISDALVERVLQKLRSHPSVINAPGPSSSAQGMTFVGPIAIVGGRCVKPMPTILHGLLPSLYLARERERVKRVRRQ